MYRLREKFRVRLREGGDGEVIGWCPQHRYWEVIYYHNETGKTLSICCHARGKFIGSNVEDDFDIVGVVYPGGEVMVGPGEGLPAWMKEFQIQ